MNRLYYYLTMLAFSVFMVPSLPALEISSDSSSSTQRQEGISANGIVECSGIIMPAQRYTVVLASDQRVVECTCHPQDFVAAGAPLMRLASNTLTANYLGLLEKRLALKQERDRIALLKTRIGATTRSIADLAAQIEKERRINKEIPGYSTQNQLDEWLSEKKQKETERTLLQQEVDQFQNRWNDFEALVRTTAQSITSLEDQIRRMDIKAPFDGKVMAVDCRPDHMESGHLVLDFIDHRHFQVFAKAWQNQLESFAPGDKAKVYPNFFKNRFLQGTVRMIGPAENKSDSAFPVFPVVIDVDTAPEDIRVGMAVSVEILGGKRAKP